MLWAASTTLHTPSSLQTRINSTQGRSTPGPETKLSKTATNLFFRSFSSGYCDTASLGTSLNTVPEWARLISRILDRYFTIISEWDKGNSSNTASTVGLGCSERSPRYCIVLATVPYVVEAGYQKSEWFSTGERNALKLHTTKEYIAFSPLKIS